MLIDIKVDYNFMLLFLLKAQMHSTYFDFYISFKIINHNLKCLKLIDIISIDLIYHICILFNFKIFLVNICLFLS